MRRLGEGDIVRTTNKNSIYYNTKGIVVGRSEPFDWEPVVRMHDGREVLCFPEDLEVFDSKTETWDRCE